MAAEAAPAPEARRALTSSASADWGSPVVVQRLGASVLRPAALLGPMTAVDVDAMSSAYWNAQWPGGYAPAAYLDGSPGLDLFDGTPRVAGAWYCNPAGDLSGETVQRAWDHLEQAHASERVDSLFWVGFSLEQLASLQNAGVGAHPLSPHVTTLLPSRRTRYRVHPEGMLAILDKKLARAKTAPVRDALLREISALAARVNAGDLSPCVGDAPTHASYFSILWHRDRKIRQRQQLALRHFLKAEAGDSRSIFARVAVVGRAFDV